MINYSKEISDTFNCIDILLFNKFCQIKNLLQFLKNNDIDRCLILRGNSPILEFNYKPNMDNFEINLCNYNNLSRFDLCQEKFICINDDKLLNSLKSSAFIILNDAFIYGKNYVKCSKSENQNKCFRKNEKKETIHDFYVQENEHNYVMIKTFKYIIQCNENFT